MRSLALLAGTLAVAATLLAIPSASFGALPPNRNDPCESGGKNICGTTDVGFYKTARYGTRWYGDFRGAVPGESHTYCIDLRFWYPSPDYHYQEVAATGLRNKDGESVSVSNQQKIAYAIWTYGRSVNENQAAAVMLYVHSLMGDARPGELDPTALNASVASLYKKVSTDAARFHGPYRVEVKLPSEIGVGKQATATIRVFSAAGNALPNLDLSLFTKGATGVPAKVQTNANGVATVTARATSATGVRLTAVTEPVASTLPRIFHPTTAAAGPNGQRVAVPDSQRVTSADTSTGSKAKLSLTTAATPATIAVGEESTDKVTISGALPTYRGKVVVRLYGPFRTAGQISCTGVPVAAGSFDANGSGSYTTPATLLDKPGLYVYQEIAPGDANHIGFTSPCNTPSERVRVEAVPTLQTLVSAQTAAVGDSITDQVTVQGLAGEHVTVTAALYGPFATRETITCTGTPLWTGTIDVPADGIYTTEPFTLTKAGYYTYLESIDATDFVRAVKTACADVAETVIVPAKPKLKTRVSTQQARLGGTITDKVAVIGLGALAVPVQAELFGPFATRAAISCSGTPHWRGSFVARGDGTYTTAPVKVDAAGYYTYRESIIATVANTAVTTACADVAETTVAHATPKATTIASSEVVYPGSSIFDRIRVSGLGKTVATIDVALYGPFATRSAIKCSGRPYWQGRVVAHGDGEIRTPSVRLATVGLYIFRERIVGTPLVDAFSGECGLVAETSLAAPQIITGRGDVSRFVRVRAGTGNAPRRVQLESLGIDAPVSPVGIDLQHSVLGVPPSIAHTAWWKDGAAPGAKSGSILIAGHVDSARRGAGAFFKLHSAKVGDRVKVTTANGRTRTYRVVSVKNYVKSKLPTSVWSLKGSPRLVLVTCGGPFLQAERHYRDNVVVTAVPV